jgi:hypothetical protein
MSGGPPTESPSAASGDPLAPPGSPTLPPTRKRADHEFDRAAEVTVKGVPTAPVYRTEQQRAKSVYRRANPWYRRLARGVIGLAFLAAGATALWFGAQELQDYLNRDKLPAAGADIPAYRTTSFQIASSTPSPVLDGELTIDVNSRAFVYSSRPGQPSVRIVSPDGSRVLVEDGGTWRAAGPGDTAVTEIAAAIPYLVGVDTADDILINRMRNGYVELVEQETEGVDETALERYTISIDVDRYNVDQPLQWQSFQQEVVPGVGTTGVVELTFWLDTDNVLVRLVNPSTGWSWERVSRSTEGLTLPPEALAAG